MIACLRSVGLDDAAWSTDDLHRDEKHYLQK